LNNCYQVKVLSGPELPTPPLTPSTLNVSPLKTLLHYFSTPIALVLEVCNGGLNGNLRRYILGLSAFLSPKGLLSRQGVKYTDL